MAFKNKADATAYQNKYIAASYDRINLTLPKGQKGEIKAHASARDESVNAFIGRAIGEAMERDAGAVVTGTPAGWSVSLPVEIREEVEAAARAEDITVDLFIRRAVFDYLNK